MTTPIAQLDRGALKRTLGVFDLFAIGYGDLGSSIYYALGVTAFFALGATPLALVLAGFVFICTALSYAEMASIFHETGGSATYARHAFNDLISFIAGWGLLLDYVVTIAISAFTIGPYLIQFFPVLMESSIQIIFTISIILLLLTINIRGAKGSTRFSFFLMLLTVIMQLVIIGIGLFAIDDFSRFFSQIKINQPGINTSPSWTDFMKGVAMAMVAYTGIESIAQLGSETKRPVRAVPRAIMLTMVVLIFMYLGLSFVGFSLVNPYQFGHLYEAQPVVGIVSHLPVLRQFLVPCVGILAAMTLFVAANAGLIGASRLSFSMGEHYQLPRFLYKLHPRFKTPYTALIFFAVIACIVVALSKAKISHLADLYNFGAQIAFFSTQVALIVLRIKRPDLRRPFKVPFNVKIKGREIPILAVIGAISSFAVWMLIVITKPEGRYFGFTWILIGLVMYYAYRKKQKISPTTQVVIEKIKLSQFKTEPIRKILLPLRSQAQIELMTRAIDLAKQHKAEMLILHVIEVPFSLPLETPLPHRVEMAAPVLKMAEAIARDKEVSVELEIVRARSIEEAILDIARVRAPDLMILESTSEGGQGKALGSTVAHLLSQASCRIWIMRS